MAREYRLLGVPMLEGKKDFLLFCFRYRGVSGSLEELDEERVEDDEEEDDE
jgi:hypothetical protein